MAIIDLLTPFQLHVHSINFELKWVYNVYIKLTKKVIVELKFFFGENAATDFLQWFTACLRA